MSKYSKCTKKKNYTWNSTYKDMVGQNDFTSKTIFLYNLQRDKTLSTSKKELTNGGTSN
jgi:hypothetical protein